MDIAVIFWTLPSGHQEEEDDRQDETYTSIFLRDPNFVIQSMTD